VPAVGALSREAAQNPKGLRGELTRAQGMLYWNFAAPPSPRLDGPGRREGPVRRFVGSWALNLKTAGPMAYNPYLQAIILVI
jgi:hypothetical protein